MKIEWAAVKSVAVYVLGLASVVVGSLQADDIKNSTVRAVLVAVGGALLVLERYVQGNVAAAKARAPKPL